MRDTRLVRTSVDGDDHTLVLRRSPDETSRFDAMFDLLPGGEPADVLAVTYQRSDQFLQEWRERLDRRPRNVGVVSAGEQMRSAAETPTPVERTPLYGVADPTDTEEIRRVAARYLDAWPADGRTVVYFDSVTALSNSLDAEDAIDFLDRFRETLDDHGAVGYFGVTPAAHDRTVVRRVASGFDTVVECVETDVETGPEPSVDDCLDAMADTRRRHLLAAVAQGEPVTVEDLADYVAERSSADREAVRVSLVSVHLPKLADRGILAYDRAEGVVAPGVYFEGVVPFLREAPDVDAVPCQR